MMSAVNSLRRRLRGVVSLGTFVAIVVAVGVSLLYLAWVATIRSSDQIGALSIGTFVVGLSCTFAALMLTTSMIRAIRSARDGRAMLAALLAGGFAIAAGIALGASNVLGQLAS
jgi:TRAP-type C4-dicarboxylate transport system permease small subunit